MDFHTGLTTKKYEVRKMNKFYDILYKKIQLKEAKIGIIGMGYVGLPLALEFADEEFHVTGFDIDGEKVKLLNSGVSYIKHINSDRIYKSLKNGSFSATSDFSRLTEMDVIIICVPTPLNKNREPDLSFIVSTARTISENFKPGKLIVLESSTYPGTTEEILLPLFEKPLNEEYKNTTFRAGEDFFLAFSPEREDPNNPDYTTKTIPKVIGGHTENCLKLTKLLYDNVIVKTVPVSSTRVAEAVKLLENIYRAVNIALVNELKMVFYKMNIDIWEVIEAAKTKPFGFHAFYPGPGLGGHCIPIDPFYLTWKAREYEVPTKFIELAGEINTNQPYFVVERTIKALNEYGKAIKGSKILLLGVAYKKNVDDLRESPALKLMEIFDELGAEIDYHDPFIQTIPKLRNYNFNKSSIPITPENLKQYDAVIVVTEHDYVDYELVKKNSKLIIDTRNVYKLNGIRNGSIIKA